MASSAAGQSIQPELRITVREDDQAVYLYHTALPAIGHGFNIYRKEADADRFEQINTDPIRGVTSGTELRAYLGTLYDDIEQTTGQSDANGTLTKLRSDVRTANLLTFTYPKVAEALGRLYIDSSAPVGSAVTYKIEFVDALDTPTGVELEQTLLLFPHKPLPPTQLRARNRGNRITLYWQYQTNEGVDDKVIQFLVYRIDPSTNRPEQLNQKVILRNNAIFEYTFTFDVPTTGQTEQLYVRAVDISGQLSEPSELLRYETGDFEPPNVILDVQTRVLANQRVQVQWTPSSEEDIAGYNLYRSGRIDVDSAYVRLNEEVLNVNETTYNDTLLAQTDSQVYYYRVKALDAHGNESAYSTAALAIIEDRIPPPPPSRVEAAYLNDETIELSWRHPEETTDLSTYIVLRQSLAIGSPDFPSRVNRDTLTGRSIIDHGVAGLGFKEGATYRYSVLSVDRSGNQSRPAEIEIQIPDLSAPMPANGLHAMIGNAPGISLLWNPSPSTDVMSYVIYRRKAGSTRLKATPVPRHQLRFDDANAERGVTYDYWITAADIAGNESLPSQKVSITMRDFTPPRNVRNIQVLPQSENETLIQWEPVPSFDLAGYRVYRSMSMTGSFEPISEALITLTSWIDENAVEGSWYKVFAVDTSGNESPPSLPTRAVRAEFINQ